MLVRREALGIVGCRQVFDRSQAGSGSALKRNKL